METDNILAVVRENERVWAALGRFANGDVVRIQFLRAEVETLSRVAKFRALG